MASAPPPPSLRAEEEDTRCFECEAACADDVWVSLPHAVRLCLRCAGAHRALGVQISFVRSLSLDELKPAEEALLARGGNARFRRFLEENGVPRHVWLELELDLRYHTPAADLYRRILLAEVQGSDPPTDLRLVEPPPARAGGERSGGARTRAEWTPDAEAPVCQLCKRKFWLLERRHHCRRCGRCVCGPCSPKESARPLSQLGKAVPVRHCVLCVPRPARTLPGIGPAMMGSGK